MTEPMTTHFHVALAWHENAKVSAPGAMSVKHTQAILDELNEAIELLNSPSPISPKSQSFLARHTGAPY